jgi:hypothetical protein
MLKPSVASVFLLFLQHGSEFVRRRNVAVSQSRTLLCQRRAMPHIGKEEAE